MQLKDKYGQTFLYNIVFNDNDNEAPSILTEILNLIKINFEFDQVEFKSFIFQVDSDERSLLHYYALKYRKSTLSLLIQKFLRFISNEFGMDAVSELVLLIDKHKQTFLYNIILNDIDNEASLNLIGILDLLKIEFKITNNFLFSIICSENYEPNSLLNLICHKYEVSNMESMLILLINWFNENLTQSQLNDLLFCKTDEGKFFLQILLERPETCKKDELEIDENLNLINKTKLLKECCKISYKIILRLYEIISDNDNLITLLQQKYSDNLSLIEFLISENES
jgi:hypothetical protein